jgi:hypothetical protein
MVAGTDVRSPARARLVASVVTLAGLPLAALLFVWLVPRDDDRTLMGAVERAFAFGSESMYVLAACAPVLALAGAVARWTESVRAQVVLVGLSLLTVAIGAAGYARLEWSMLEVIGRTAAVDRTVVAFGSFAEGAWNTALAALVVGSALLTQGFALALTARGRVAQRLVAAGTVCLGAWQVAVARTAVAEHTLRIGMAHAEPAARLTRILEGVPAVQGAQHLGLLALAGVAVTVVLALALLRGAPRTVAGVSAAVLVPLAGLGGLEALCRPHARAMELVTTGGLLRPLQPLRARELVSDLEPWVTVGERYHDANDTQPPLSTVVSRRGVPMLGLEPGFSVQALSDVLLTLRSMGVARVRLVGVLQQETPPDVPSALRVRLVDLTAIDVFLQVKAGDPETMPFELAGQTSNAVVTALESADARGQRLLLVLPQAD